MRVAAIYDVHANLPALQAVLAEVAAFDPDLIVFGGDLFDGPMPRETIQLVRRVVQRRFVRGNGERLLLEHYARDGPPPGEKEAADYWCAKQLTPDERDFIARSAEDSFSLDIPTLGATFFCHGSPRSVEEIITPRNALRRRAPGSDGHRCQCRRLRSHPHPGRAYG
jgi:Calcineurin-like phosphoesterase